MKTRINKIIATSVMIFLGLILSPNVVTSSDGELLFFPHISDCSKYYECINGRAVERDCPPGLHFNEIMCTCDWPELAGCDKSYSF